MVTFAYPAGLLLLLVIPLLLFFRRRRAQPRRRLLAAAFLLAELRLQPHGRTLRVFRLSRAQRLLLLALLLGCLSAAIAGAALDLRRIPPERWLLVVDNTPSAAARFDGAAVLDAIRQHLLAVTAGAAPDDTITVLTTSPAPASRTFAPGPQLREHLRSLAAAPRSAAVEEGFAIAEELAGRYQRAVLFSPRAAGWRRLAARRPTATRLVIPEDAQTAVGNRGFVHCRLRANPEQEGKYDLFLLVRAAPEKSEKVPLELAHNGVVLPTPPAVELRQGAGRIFLDGLALAPGSLAIALPGGEAYALDDRIQAVIPTASPIAVSLPGGSAAGYEDVIRSGALFRLAEDGAGEVDIFVGAAPPTLTRPTLLIAPVRDQLGLRFQQLSTVRGDVRWHPDHPVTAPLRGRAFRPEQALSFSAAPGYESLASSDGIPILLAGERDGRRVLVWLFDPLDRSLFLKPEFVILFRESIQWLAGRGEVPTSPDLDERTTVEAASLGLPLLEKKLFARGPSGARRVDLEPYLLLGALLLGAYLALADALGPEDDSA